MHRATPPRGYPLVLGALLLILLPACPPAHGPCAVDSDCASTQLCVDGRCQQVCNSAGDCEAGEVCRDGVCRARGDGGARDATAGDGFPADRSLAEGPAADLWTPLDGPASDHAGAADATATDGLSTPDSNGLDGPLADQAAAVDAADPCSAARCPTNTTCLALYDGSVLCLCGDRECGDNELCRLPDIGTASARCCGPAQLNCGGLCKDILDDERNCGGCNRACAFGELCLQAQCVCGGVGSCQPATQDCCNGVCVDVATDEAHCGPPGTGVGCSFACPGTLPCVDGLCQCSSDADCGGSLTCCDSRYCADLASDLHNCRACGAVCRPGEICGSAGCTCSATCDDGDPCTADSCAAGRCAHHVLDADRDGYCAPGCSDPSGADCLDGDCNDADPEVNPGELEVCDGKDNDCSSGTADGVEECAGLCCGTPRACQGCCSASQCGSGSWECTGTHQCHCEGLDCAGHCYASGACCDSPNLCGGCSPLSAQPGTRCGTCGAYKCQGTEDVVCSGDLPVDGDWSGYTYTPFTNDGSCGQYTACKQRQTRTGTRTCTNPPPSCGGAACVGDPSYIDSREVDCGLVDGGWSSPQYTGWSNVGTCGQFVPCIQRQTRSGTRSCTNPAPACGGAACVGSTSVSETIDTQACGLVDGGWGNYTYTDWAPVGSCAQYQACAQREERRGTRSCTNPAPACGGSACDGPTTTDESQYLDCGDVDGGWSDWSYGDWANVGQCGDDGTPCQMTQERTRTHSCTNPPPACEGAPCVGDTSEVQSQEVACADMDPCNPGSSSECCGGGCTEVDDDPNHCGSCNNSCDSGSGYQCCSGWCTDTRFDTDNCGYCSNRCNYGPCCNYQCCDYGYCCGDYCCG